MESSRDKFVAYGKLKTKSEVKVCMQAARANTGKHGARIDAEIIQSYLSRAFSHVGSMPERRE